MKRLIVSASLTLILIPFTALAEPCFKPCGNYELSQLTDGAPLPGFQPRVAVIGCELQGGGDPWNNLQAVSFQGTPGHPAGIMFRDRNSGNACTAVATWLGDAKYHLKAATPGGNFVLQRTTVAGAPGELLVFRKL